MAAGLDYTVPSPAQTGFVAVTAGDFHGCGLQSTGQIVCWGPARDGEATPPTGTGFIDVDAGSRHTCAVSAAGRITCWGSDISGIKRVPNEADQRFVEVSVGVFAACALTDIGGVICWGADNDVVTQTPSGTGYISVIARHRQACAVAQDGGIECWGQDIQGSLAPPAGCFLPVPPPLECDIGYFPDETGCVDIDECLDPLACGMNATCTNLPGDYACECDSGFTGDGFTCTPTVPNIGQALSAGVQHNCAIRSGEIWCWGENPLGQLGDGTNVSSPAAVRVGTASDWVDIAGGADHTCAINAGGQLWCWGAGFNGELGDGTTSESSSVPVRESTGATNWAQVTAGVGHTCALNTEGEIWCWGAGFAGQLGDGSTQSLAANPTRESTSGTNWAAVKAGGDHTCALDTAGNLSCWGANPAGQLGTGTVGTDLAVATPIGGGPWDNVAVGGAHTCATRAGELYCWGSDISGQLGLGMGSQMMEVPVPTRVGTDSDWSIPVAGADMSCALKASGALWCWGANFEGQLGLGDTADRNSPTRVGIDGDWITAALPSIGAHSCGIKGANVVVCWGANFGGQLGVASSRLAPAAQIDTGSNWTSVSAFGGEDVPFNLGVSSYGCGIKNGAPWCWGAAAYNFSLTGSTSAVPGTIGNTNWTTVSSSSTHTCGLQNGAPRCWGDNIDGGLGNGTINPSSSPVIPLGTDNDTDWSAVSSGSGFTCGIKSGTLWCWGRGDEGQLGLGASSISSPTESGSTTGSMWSAVSTGHTHTCGIHAGDLYCWGDNCYGQLGDGSTFPSVSIPAMPTIMGTSFASVAAGREHTCVIDVVGNLLCTGDNTYGELGDGTTNPSTSFIGVGGAQAPWSQVAVGRDITCGVANGIAYCWGANLFGGLGDGTLNDSSTPVAVATTFTDWVELSVGDVFTCGRRQGGQVHCWGDNAQGQMGDGSQRFLTPRPVTLP